MGLSLRPMGSGGGGGGAAVKRKSASGRESNVPGARAIMYRLESMAEAAPVVHPQQVGSGTYYLPRHSNVFDSSLEASICI